MLARLQTLFLLLTCTLLVASPVLAQTSEAKPEANQVKASTNVNAPVVSECSPQSGSVNSVIELKGFRLGPDGVDRVKAFFIQNGIEIPARTSGGSFVTNDHLNGQQTLEVIVPEEVVPGPAQIVTERNGFRTAPVTVTITEWILPVIKQITPTTGPPGTPIDIECENFHIYDEIELTDGEGRLVKSFESGGSVYGTGFVVPKDFPEGVLRIRIGNRKRGRSQFTAPVEFVVTNDPLPPELTPSWIKSVAPGQWLELPILSFAPLIHAERTDVSFKQAGREIIVTAPRPRRPRVEVPAALTPGDVQVQVRTWRNRRASNWSTPVTLQLAEKPLAPDVQALRLEKDGSWVHLSVGPDRATNFPAAPGDLIVMNGIYPVAGADKLKVLLVRAGEAVELDLNELDEKANCFSELTIRLPADMRSGNWQMIVRAIDGTEHLIPIPIRVVRK